MAEHDGVSDAVSDSFRTALMAAGRIGEQLARVRENQLRHAEANSAQEARELQNRFDVERLAARAELAVVAQEEWWGSASADDITAAWQTANAWRTVDPEVERSATRIESEVAGRWGLDVNATGASADQVRARLQQIIDARVAADDERDQAKRAEAEAAELLLEADALRDSRAAGHVEDVSADEEREGRIRGQAQDLTEIAGEHRSAAAAYDDVADNEVREAKVAADKGQAYPPAAATAKPPKRARPRARRAGNQQAQEQVVSR